MLYTGLILTTIGSAQVRPCMSALVSLYTPPHDQGRILGVFRSLEGLTRAISPLLACLLYWNLGAPKAYSIAACAILGSLLLALTLPDHTQ
jgi:MFS family permease